MACRTTSATDSRSNRGAPVRPGRGAGLTVPSRRIRTMTRLLRRAALGLALLAAALTGCGPSSVKVTGKLLKNGSPMVVSDDTYVTLSFVPEKPAAEGEKSYSAKFDQKTGSYAVELPPGKY